MGVFIGKSKNKVFKSTKSQLSSTQKMQNQVSNYEKRLKNAGVDSKDVKDDRNWLEKALNLRKNQGFFGDLFEVIGRPQQALFGGISEAQKGGNFFEGVGKGFTGKKETSGKEILTNWGMSDRKGKLDLVDVLGLGADMFADPVDLALLGVTIATGGSAAPATVPALVAKTADTVNDTAKVVKAADKVHDAAKAIDAAHDAAKAVKTANKAYDIARATDTATDVAQAMKKESSLRKILTRGAKPTNIKIGDKVLARQSLSQIFMNSLGEGVKGVGKLGDLGLEKILGKVDAKNLEKFNKLISKGMSKADALEALGKRTDKLDIYRDIKKGVSNALDSSKHLGGLLGKSRDIDNLSEVNESLGKIAIKDLDDKVRAIAKGDQKLYDNIARNINTLVEADYDWSIKGDEILKHLKPNKKVDMFNEENARLLARQLKKYGIDSSIKDGRYLVVKSKAGDKALNLLKTDKKLSESFNALDFGKRLSKADVEDIENAKKFFNSNPAYKELLDDAKTKIKDIANRSDTLTGLNASNITKEGYVPHVLTDDAKKELDKIGRNGNNQFNARKYQMTTNEANRFKKAEMEAKKANIDEAIEKKSGWFKKDKNGNIKFDSNGNAVKNEAAYNEVLSKKEKTVTNLKAQKESAEELIKFKNNEAYDVSKLSKKDKEIVELAQKQGELKGAIKTLDNINYSNIENVGAIEDANSALTKYNREQRKLQTAIKNGVSGDELTKIKNSIDEAAKEVRIKVQSLEKYANKQSRDAVKNANKAFKEGKNLGTKIQKQTDMFYKNGETINAAYDAAEQMTEKLTGRIELAEADLLKYKGAKEEIFNRKLAEIGKLQEANNILSDPNTYDFFNNNFMSNIGDYVERNAKFSRGAQVYNEALTSHLFDNPDYVKLAGDLKDGKVPHNFVKVNGGKLNARLEKFNGILPEESKVLSNTIKKFGNKDIYLDKDFARVLGVASSSNDIHPLVKVWDGINNTFKKFSTLSLGFQTRNIIGNSTNMVLSGMPAARLPEYYAKATSLLNKSDNLMKKFAEKGLDAFTDAEKAEWKTLLQWKKAGFGDAFIKGQGLEDIAKVKKGPLNKVSNASVKLNNKIDGLNRMTLLMYANDHPKYIQKLGKTNAIDAVRYALFDPSNMSSFEKNVMKRAMPFYTFTKQNLLFQADNIMRNTPKYNRLMKGMNSLYKAVGEDKYWGYQKDAMQIPLPFTDSKGNTLFLKANLPVSDLGEFISNPLQRAVSSTSPIIKAPFETVTGVDTFTGQKLNNTTLSGTLNKMGIKNVPKGIKSSTDAAETILKNMGVTNLTTNMVKRVSKIIDKAKGEDVSGRELWATIFSSVLQNTNQEKIENARLYEDLETYQSYIKDLKNQGIAVPTIREINQQSKKSLRKVKTRRNKVFKAT